MTDNEIRIAIAECLGKFEPSKCKPSIEQLEAILENKSPLTVVTLEISGEIRACPDYPNDLNAMHEAINSLPEELQFRFTEKLESVIKPLCGKPWTWIWLCATATARQRAEAFLRTIGKWKEGGV